MIKTEAEREAEEARNREAYRRKVVEDQMRKNGWVLQGGLWYKFEDDSVLWGQG